MANASLNKQHSDLQPTLEDELVIVRPLTEGDFEALYQVASDPAIWEQHPAKERSEREGFAKFFAEAMQSQSAFVIVDKSSGEVIGTSRYNLSKEAENAIEIGWTFLAKKYWGGACNKAVKKLMVNHAFKTFELVLFYVHKDNLRSQKAVEKIGGKRIHELNGKTLEIRPSASVVFRLEKGYDDGLL